MKEWLWVLGALLGVVALLGIVVVLRAIRVRATKGQMGSKPLPKEEETAKKLAGAVRFATVSTPYSRTTDFAPFEGMIAYLQQQFPHVAALQWERVVQHSLLIRYPGKTQGHPSVFLAHMDVVPVVADQWSRDPFSGDMDDTYVYGRGSCDMKGHMIMVLQAAEELLEKGFVPENDIYFCFGHDEEVATGEEGGAHNLVQTLRARGITPGMVIDEGGGMQAARDNNALLYVGVAEKGYMDVELVVEQKGGHSAVPPRNTALVQLARAIVRLERHQMPYRLIPLIRAHYEALAPFAPFGKRLVYANLWLLKGVLIAMLKRDPGKAPMLHTTLAATMASGSPQANVLPSRAVANINLRLLPGDTDETVVRHIRHAIRDAQVQIVVKRYVPASPVSPLDSPEYARLCAAVDAIEPGITPVPNMMLGGTDSRHYSAICPNVFKCTPVLCAGDNGAHAANEKMERAALTQGKEAFRELMLRS